MPVASDAHSRPAGQLKVHTMTGIGQHFVIDAIARYRKAHPDVTFDLTLANRVPDLLNEGSVIVQLITALTAPWLATRGKDQRLAIVLVMSMTLAGLFGCLYAPLDGLWGWAIVLRRRAVSARLKGAVCSWSR